jgi:hypothetical protein
MDMLRPDVSLLTHRYRKSFPPQGEMPQNEAAHLRAVLLFAKGANFLILL